MKKTYGIRRLVASILMPTIHQQHQDIPRPMITFVKEHFGDKELVGVEIGVDYGANAENMLKILRINKLFLVDPYEAYQQNEHMHTASSRRFLLAKARLARFGKTEFVRMEASEACNVIPNGLDFVYIDGNHQYDYVKSDIELYYPKVRDSGVIGGNDFFAGGLGVVRAVIEFTNKNKLKLKAKRTDWWIVKT